MTALEELMKAATAKGADGIPGIVLLGADGTGKEIYHEEYGFAGFESDEPISSRHVFKIASCTKLVTAISALQCVERGQVTLDEPISRVLPETKDLKILKWKDQDKGTTELYDNPTPITLRQLLTHSSGMTYAMMPVPIMQAYNVSGEDKTFTAPIPEAFGLPLVFEPGQGWCYSPGLDWAGLAISRLNNCSLEQYFNKNIWEPLGVAQPYPTLDLDAHDPAYKARLVRCAERDSTGKLKPGNFPLAESPPHESGGAGLASTPEQYLAVLSDIVSEKPKLLREESMTALYTPQFLPRSPGIQDLKSYGWVYGFCTGGDPNADVNQGLGGMLLQSRVESIETPANTLTWGGMPNLVWFANREKGIAGFYASQILPPSEPKTLEPVAAFQRDFWSRFGKA